MLFAVERPMEDSWMSRALSGLRVKHMFEQILCMSFMESDRGTESRSWMSRVQRTGRRD